MTNTISFSTRKVISIALISLLLIGVISVGLKIQEANALVRTAQVSSSTNPAWPNKCGLKIGLLIDRSNSISTSEGNSLKSAANGFVDSLTGTPSQFAVAQFRKTASQTLGFTSVFAPAGATTVKNTINGYTFGTSDSAGSTNWDAAFQSQKNLGADVVIILTDGNPTQRGINGEDGNGSSDPFGYNLDAGITSANEVKANGARIVAVGIGSDVDVSNLQAISGPTANDDYFTSSFDTLNAKLLEIAKKICGGTVTVQKQIKNADGSYSTANGWDYTATNAVVTSKTTSGSGTAEFKFDGTPKATTITETVKPGYSVESVVCTSGGQQKASGTTASISFTVNVDEIVSCIFKNKPNVATITINKVANGGNATFPFTSNLPNKANFNIATASGAGTTGSITVPAGTYEVTESALSGWTFNSVSCTGTNVTVAGAKVTINATTDSNTTCTYTNTRQTGTLRIVKNVVSAGGVSNGTFGFNTDTSLGNFNLTTVNGTAQTSIITVPTGNYNISETLPSGWSLSSLDCSNSSEVVNGSSAVVPVGANQNVVCTFTNTRQTGTLRIVKNVVSAGGVTDGTFGFSTDTSLGNFNLSTIGGTAQTGTVTVPTGSYNISETVPAGWTLTSLVCTGTSATINGSNASLNIQNGENVVCTFTNTRQTGTLRIVKNVVSAGGVTDGTFGFSTDTSLGNFQLTTSGGTAQSSIAILSTGNYNISEVVPSGWNLTSLECSNSNETVNGSSAVVPVVAGANVVCTFTNTRQTANLRVVKNVTAAGGISNGIFDFSSNTPLGNFQLTTVSGSATTQTVTVPTGTFEISETVPAGWTLNSVQCSQAQESVQNSTVSVPLTAGANVVCTFTNTRQTGTLRIVKNVVSAGGVSNGTFGFNTDTSLGNFNLTTIGGTAQTGTVTVPTGSFNISETVPSGWSLSSLECSNSNEVVNGSTAVVPVTAGADVVCTFTNTRDTATIKVVKNVVSAGGVTDGSFGFESNTSLGDFNLSTIGGTAQTGTVTVPTGSYSISETVPAGWSLTSLVCTGTDETVDGSSVSFVVSSGSDVVCTFTNTRQTGTLKVVKNVTVAGGVADGSFDFESKTPLGDFTLTTSGGTAQTSTVSIPTGSYSLAEVVPSDWSLTSVVCTGTDETVDGSSVSFVVSSGSDVVCTFTNTRQTGTVKIVKNTIGGNGTFDFKTSLPVSDISLTTVDGTATSDTFTVPTGTYSVKEIVPSGWDLTSATCSGSQSESESDDIQAQVGNGENIVCTFTNTRQTANLQIVKEVVERGGVSDGTFEFETDTSLGNFSLTTVDGIGESEIATLPTGTYSVKEIVPSGWELTGVECFALTDEEIIEPEFFGQQGSFLVDGNELSIELDANEDIVCVFTNERQTATIQIKEIALGGNDTFEFTSDSLLGDFGLTTTDGTAQTSVVEVPTGTYTFGQNPLATWSLTNLVCTGGETTVNSPNVVATVEAGDEVVCTFTNTKDPVVLGTVVTIPPRVEVKGTSATRLPTTGAGTIFLFSTATLLIGAGMFLNAVKRKKNLIK